jgi:diguanylate cyclase (GGDEF)-like protein
VLKSPRRLLLIDDDPMQFKVVQEMLRRFQRERFELEWDGNYESALAKLTTGDFCACLLDYQLGTRDGLQLLRDATAAQCHTPVIVLTGWGTEDVDVAAMRAGASDYLNKDEITPRLLERALRYALKLGDTLASLRHLATRDEVTGLLNRRELERILAAERQRAGRFLRTFALLLIDLDQFKAINDTHGHPAGDRVLRHVAELLLGQTRAADTVARYGGDELAIIQIEGTPADALAAARRLCEVASATPCPQPAPGEPISFSLSIGVATYPLDGDSVEQLIAAADRALYAAKSKGRNCACLASDLPPPSPA